MLQQQDIYIYSFTAKVIQNTWNTFILCVVTASCEWIAYISKKNKQKFAAHFITLCQIQTMKDTMSSGAKEAFFLFLMR